MAAVKKVYEGSDKRFSLSAISAAITGEAP